MTAAELDRLLRVIYTDPKLKATLEWSERYSIFAQLFGQVPRPEIEKFVAGAGWEHPEREITIELHEQPDFDWWEPRHDQPWRRQDARKREAGL